MRFALCLLLIFPAIPGLSQPKSGVIRGRVVDEATKQGIPRALVTATPGQMGTIVTANRVAGPGGMEVYGATADEEGSFQISELPPGSYMVSAQKSGYLSTHQLMSRPGRPLQAVPVEAGKESQPQTVALTKQAVITGRVLNADGDPVEGASVQAMPVSTGSGGGGGGQTDDRGEFRIPRLAPGSYKLAASRHSMGMITMPRQTRPLLVDAPTYFPSSLDAASAAEIRVGAGEERSGTDIRLQRTAAVRVSGRVTGEIPPQTHVQVSLLPEMGGMARAGARPMLRIAAESQTARSQPDGEFQFAAVRPGDYVLMAHGFRPGSQLTGYTKVRVGTNDIEGLSVSVAPGFSLQGKVTVEGERKPPFEQMHVSLAAAEAGLPGGSGGQVKADGSFTLENVQGNRLIVMPMAPAGFFLKTVVAGGQRLPGLEVDLSAGETSLELIYSDKPAVVEGSVEDAPAESGPAIAWLYPVNAEGKFEASNISPMLSKQAAVDMTTKRFRFEGVRPGTYRLFAGAPMLSQSLLDPAAWERLKEKGVEVKAAEGVTVPVTVRLIAEKDAEGLQ